MTLWLSPMVSLPPRSLPENAGLAFLGEDAWPASVLTEREVRQLLAARNPCGRPNGDVLRRRLAVVDGEPAESWLIDFPDHFTAQEAALYEQPFALLQKRSGGRWEHPHLQPDLRRALARLSRFLAQPTTAAATDWRWIEEDRLPDASLLVVARDDDYAHGVLSSPVFALWWQQHRLHPLSAVTSFPFPWPPATTLSALTAPQEEHRHAIARTARGGHADALHAAVLAAYGWTRDVEVAALREKLTGLNRDRSARPDWFGGGLSSR